MSAARCMTDEALVFAEGEEAPKKITVLLDNQVENPGTCGTFLLYEEDHTLGNALRHCLMSDERVEFTGYTIPHPSEPYTNLRLQTSGDPAVEVLRSGLVGLERVCDVVEQKFQMALDKFQMNKMSA